jgi:nitrate reductase gamma subunit
MEFWLELARGPVFVFAFTFMVLGLLRHAALTIWETVRAVRRAGDKTLPVRTLACETLAWLVPVGKLKTRLAFSLTSIIFHITILTVPIFLGGHIVLWARGTGLAWPAFPNVLADVLTIIAIVCAVALVVQRIAARATRGLSRFQDYVIPLIVVLPFVSGYLVMHPGANPFSYEAMLFVHVMSGNLVFVLIPLTKLSHFVLFPGVQLVSSVGWHFPPHAGSELAVTLGKENEPI